MKRLKGIYSAVLVICAILLAASCEKRPLLDLSNTHYVRVYVDENLLNVTKGFYDESYEKPAYKSPGILRVTLTDPESGIVKAEAAMYACKVQLFCEKCGKQTRAAHKMDGDKKIRVCAKCGAAL